MSIFSRIFKFWPPGPCAEGGGVKGPPPSNFFVSKLEMCESGWRMTKVMNDLASKCENL